ncbi:hypothetical protein BO71DRAFT_355965 [Aspergillus ellipticus CBS 707.79]|uniref:UBC core domain-containing protein n=1 Tax=Aspergillus ellipticus CBS 707.79 TaxID=1448320 RepID=A0A319D7F0_9EURO|nr:hypothetical protein BO71DRAFT_355965 [Aspergillus ellipticus CBS 707.79]
MPRKAFLQDLSQVSAPGTFTHLSRVRLGDEDSTVIFTYTCPISAQTIDFNVAILDVSEYPDGHSYFAFSAADNLPGVIATILETVQLKFRGWNLEKFLECFCDYLDQAARGQLPIPDLQMADDFDGNSDTDQMDWDELSNGPEIRNSADTKRLRVDLRVTKLAGFKVGYLGDPAGAITVTVSCRINKLGISEDAMQMWNVLPSQFIVLLLRYPQGYAGMDRIFSQSHMAPDLVHMHVGICDAYKPTVESFADVIHHLSPVVSSSKAEFRLRASFITESLEGLLNERFLHIIRYRLRHDFSWTGAELFYNDSQGKSFNAKEAAHYKYHVSEKWNKFTPGFIKADGLSQRTSSFELALPLVAMQYMLRRFVKCAEFCLNCHCKTDANFEALQPYVCSNPLCLYQYMQLGMGPKLEWEIVSQQYVVDMLVSFTYARASTNELTDLPIGLGLKVPWVVGLGSTTTPCTAVFDAERMMLWTEQNHNVKEGEWVVIKAANDPFSTQNSPSLHCIVLYTGDGSFLRLSEPVILGFVPNGEAWKHEWNTVKFVPYRTNFDQLSNKVKMEAIMMLLDTLPNVHAMKTFITSGGSPEHNTPLSSWTQRISPSALYVLRWIVASNRSCIVHDDNPKHRVTGMGNYMQFRLAQGSPDKEERLVQALQYAQSKDYPTLFAWHGSPLNNWHSILREGLNFARQLHGRSRGHGVYMASMFDTSSAYTSQYMTYTGWSQSTLGITGAMSLNEIVNAPSQFVCKNPFVVAQLDWIQPRYLFIFCKPPKNQWKPGTETSKIYKQDPHHIALGPNGSHIKIPVSALSTRDGKSREAALIAAEKEASAHAKKKQKSSEKGIPKGAVVITLGDDADSVTTLIEDRQLLESDTEEELKDLDSHQALKKSYTRDDLSKTDFRPGTLKTDTLKLLGPPSYATTQATKCLQRHLRETMKVQDREPLHELGWYVDPTLISTVYQWVVELHSFDPSLPLARDLKQFGLTSIVLELRFPPEFPISPPFVRVIRPRFLPFMHQGGGHVTAGGAMCMELLTSSGWLPTATIESVLMQVRLAICSTDPWPARLAKGRDYAFQDAVAAFIRACQVHGWKVPEDFSRIQA